MYLKGIIEKGTKKNACTCPLLLPLGLSATLSQFQNIFISYNIKCLILYFTYFYV